MGISISEIGLNKCYLTALGQVRRVLKLGNGRVTYKSRGKTVTGGSWGEQNTVADGDSRKMWSGKSPVISRFEEAGALPL